MADATLGAFLRHVCRHSPLPCETILADDELLQAFVTLHDPDAFAVLVRRHGPMVMNVCRRGLHHREDAEDTFQATFYMRALKAASVRRREALASWVHGAAYRSALAMKRALERRRTHEARVSPRTTTTPNNDLVWREIEAILDEEIQRLAEKYRTSFVHFDLEGLGRADVARRIGIEEGTSSRRLDQARKLSQQQLSRRGMSLSAVQAASALTPPLGTTIVSQSLLLATPNATSQGSMSATIAGVVEAILRTTTLARHKMLTALVLMVGVIAGLAGIMLHSPHSTLEANVAAPPPARVDQHGDALPEGAVARLGTLRVNHGEALVQLYFSPDDKAIYSEGGGWLRKWDAVTGEERGQIPSALTYPDETLVLTPDGKTLVAHNRETGGNGDTVRIWDVITMKEVRPFAIPVPRSASLVATRFLSMANLRPSIYRLQCTFLI